jgi:hypothetical protein
VREVLVLQNSIKNLAKLRREILILEDLNVLICLTILLDAIILARLEAESALRFYWKTSPGATSSGNETKRTTFHVALFLLTNCSY